MGTFTTYTVMCDENMCGNSFSADTMAEALEEATKANWEHTSDGEYYCWECANFRKMKRYQTDDAVFWRVDILSNGTLRVMNENTSLVKVLPLYGEKYSYLRSFRRELKDIDYKRYLTEPDAVNVFMIVTTRFSDEMTDEEVYDLLHDKTERIYL